MSLKELKSKIAKNTMMNEEVISSFESNLKKRDLKQGRVGLKHPTEKEILALFDKEK